MISRALRPLNRAFSSSASLFNAKYERDYKFSIGESTRETFWDEKAQRIEWMKPYTEVLDKSRAPFYNWYKGGELNITHNLIDRHVKNGLGDNTALIHFDGYNNLETKTSFKELQDQVSRFAAILAGKDFNVKKGDRVMIYMPMITEAYVAIYAAARLGAPHSVVFGGFAAKELASRIQDAKPSVIITASVGQEPGKLIDYAKLAKEAAEIAGVPELKKIIVNRKHLQESSVKADWVFDYEELMAKQTQGHDPVPVPSDHTLYILYTSGTTGTPKGIIRSHAGTAVCLNYNIDLQQDIQAGDTYFAASDIGWIVGHSFSVYGPLLRGATSIIYEGKPTTPSPTMHWQINEKYNVKGMYSSPTAMRSIKKEDYDGKLTKAFKMSNLKSIAIAGERCDPDTVNWITSNIPKGVEFMDNWWQTEVGYPICSSHIHHYTFPIKPGSTNVPNLGYDVRIFNESNQEVERGKPGKIVIKLPLPPAFMTGLWGGGEKQERFVEKYLAETPGYYTTGDAGFMDEDNYVYVMTRVDDVINTAAHRLSTGQMEEVLNNHPAVIESSVIGKKDEIKGEVPFAFIVLSNDSKPSDELAKELNAKIRKDIGAIAKLEGVKFVSVLPKTRSGKIIRACIRQLVNDEPLKVPATIDDPSALDVIREALK